MDQIYALILVVTVLIAANALYVAAEFAIIGVRTTRLQEMVEGGVDNARRLLRIADSPRRVDDYISTAQVGITLASLGLGMYGEEGLAEVVEPFAGNLPVDETMVHGISVVVAIGVLTYLHIVIGEMVPKAVALTDPEGTAYRLAWPMRISQTIFWPLVVPLTAIGRGVLRLLRIPEPSTSERILSAEELGMVITQSAAGGLLTERAGQLMLRIFDFGEREVHQVMTPRTRVEGIPLDTALNALEERLISSSHTRIPVYDGDIDHIEGVLHVKDFVRWRLDGTTPYDLAALARKPRVVPEHLSLERLLEIFREEHGHFAVVIDEYGGTAGVVTLEDLAEEIVGEVQDEFDVELPPVRMIRPGVLAVRGDLQLVDLDEYGPLPEDRPEVDTVGGLVVTLLGRPAEVGDRVQLGSVSFRVQSTRGHAVEFARVTFRADEPPAE